MVGVSLACAAATPRPETYSFLSSILTVGPASQAGAHPFFSNRHLPPATFSHLTLTTLPALTSSSQLVLVYRNLCRQVWVEGVWSGRAGSGGVGVGVGTWMTGSDQTIL